MVLRLAGRPGSVWAAGKSKEKTEQHSDNKGTTRDENSEARRPTDEALLLVFLPNGIEQDSDDPHDDKQD